MVSKISKTEQRHVHHPIRRAGRSRILQNFVLVWLDANIDEGQENIQDSLEQLRCIISSIETFNDHKECVEYIATISDEKIFIIISGAFGQMTVPEIHENKQLDSIYLFYGKKKTNVEWCRNFTKVKGVYTDIKSICAELRKDRARCDQNIIGIGFSTIDPSFMYTQLLKEALVDMEDDNQEQAIEKLISYCRDQGNISENELKQFKNDYRAEKAIWWYTSEFFLYPMLNRALRTLDVDTILNMGFFIRHLYQQLENEYKKQDFGNIPFKVYRGQGLSKENFEKLRNTEHGLISFNNFLSTSLNERVSMSFAERSLADPNNVGILFVIQIDPSRCFSTPFAQLDDISYFEDAEKEILFSTHTIFRVDQIKPIAVHKVERLWQVELSFSNDNDNQLNQLTKIFRTEIINLNKWDRVGRILIKSGQSGKAIELYQILIQSSQNEIDNALYSNQLGWVYDDLGDYRKSLEFYVKACDIYERRLPVNHRDLATCCNNIGLVYKNMADYSKAIEFCEKALGIWKKSLPTNHPLLATSYNNIGLVYKDMEEYSKALEFYEKARDIWEESLPPYHPDLATSYTNIGLVYTDMRQYSKALEFFQKGLGIYEKSLPVNHPNLATSFNNIGQVYWDSGEYFKALEFYEKARVILEENLPADHPNLATLYSCIGLVYWNLDKYSQALQFYEKACDIHERRLPVNHRDLATCYNNIGLVYKNMTDYSKAIEFCEKALGIWKKSLPTNHPLLATSYNNIGLVYKDMKEHSKALEFYEKARHIWEESLPPYHPDLATSYNNIGLVYLDTGQCSKALEVFEKAYDIYEKCLPMNHPNLAILFNNIGQAYCSLGEYLKALEYYAKARMIWEKNLPGDHPNLATLFNNIGQVYSDMSQYLKALEFYEKAHVIWKKSIPAHKLCLASLHNNIGWAHRNMGDFGKALESFEQAANIWKESLPHNHPHLKNVLESIEAVRIRS